MGFKINEKEEIEKCWKVALITSFSDHYWRESVPFYQSHYVSTECFKLLKLVLKAQ